MCRKVEFSLSAVVVGWVGGVCISRTRESNLFLNLQSSHFFFPPPPQQPPFFLEGAPPSPAASPAAGSFAPPSWKPSVLPAGLLSSGLAIVSMPVSFLASSLKRDLILAPVLAEVSKKSRFMREAYSCPSSVLTYRRSPISDLFPARIRRTSSSRNARASSIHLSTLVKDSRDVTS